MIKKLQLIIFTAIAIPIVCRGDTGQEQYLETGELCAKAEEPKACMLSYGFQCHQSRAPDESTESYRLSCNLTLGDGRNHFVQILHGKGGSNVEVEKTYWPEYAETIMPEEDSGLALESYIRHEMKGYSMHSGGSGNLDLGMPLQFETGARRVDGRVAVRATCGVVIGVELDNAVSKQARSDCENWLLRTVMRLSQPQLSGPYRVAAPSEFEWESRFANLVSGDSALIVDGRYTFTEKHVPCHWISDCCSSNGSTYLDSCRVPTKSEMQNIDNCLAESGTHRSEKFIGCLREAGVKVGCEDQVDGSQVCY